MMHGAGIGRFLFSSACSRAMGEQDGAASAPFLMVLFYNGILCRGTAASLRVQSIPGTYTSEVCEQFSKILAQSFLSGKKTIVVFIHLASLQ